MQPGAFPPWAASLAFDARFAANGLAANSSTRRFGCALLAVISERGRCGGSRCVTGPH